MTSCLLMAIVSVHVISKVLVLIHIFVRETMVDPTAVFALLFGSELFEDYVGHLAVATMASSELSGEIDNPEKVHDKLKASMFQIYHVLEL